MSKFDEAVELYQSNLKDKVGIKKYDSELLRLVTKGLGPSIYRKDSATVSCSDQSELDRVKKNFLIKKLGLEDGPELDAAIQKVCKKMGSANRSKYRAIFYYLLVVEFGKESLYLTKA